MKTVDNSEMVNTKHAAKILGVSTKTIYRMEEKGLVQSTKTPGGQRRFDRKGLLDYLKKSTSFTAPQNPSKYRTKKIKKPRSAIREQTAEFSLFPIQGIDAPPSVSKLQEMVSLKSVRSHRLHYDAGLDVLRWIDEWDFKTYQTKTYTHGFHTYPAMFIPQVARKLIEVFSSEGETVCDIFCGSGTTLVESSLLHRNSIGIELNPLAVLIGKVKTTPIDAQTLTNDLKRILSDYKSAKRIELPRFTNIDFWFSKQAKEDLTRLKEAIYNIPEVDMRNFFLVCFSEVARIVSYTRHGEFKLYRDKKKIGKTFSPNVLREFVSIAEKNILGMKEYTRDVSANAKARIILGDSTKDNGIPHSSVDFIITSPPYGDSRTTVAYGQFSRLPAQWLDLLPPKIKDLDKELLGGKNDINPNDPILEMSETLKLSIKYISEKDKERAKHVLSFYIDLFKALHQAYIILKPKKYFCTITGNRTVKELQLKTDEIICELAEKIGFISQGILYRNIPNKRMPLKNSPTNVPGKTGSTMLKESIVLLKKL